MLHNDLNRYMHPICKRTYTNITDSCYWY